MKTKNFKVIMTTFFLIFSVGLLGLIYSPAGTPIAVINKVVKDVSIKTEESDWETAKTGIILSDKDIVRTGARSLALVSFLDGSLLRVREKSELTIYGEKSKEKLNKNTYIDEGRVSFDVAKQEDEEFKFTTPTMVASIRGTGGLIEVLEDRSTLLSLETGLVEVLARMGEKQAGTLTAGNTAYVGTDGQVKIEETTAPQLQKLKKDKKMQTKVLRIRTPNGILEIEYLPEEQ